ncbi:MAG: hypothetical protein JRI25_07455 [Deltaproteobacteria bacterium]|nr:hypothetical protein [Deltaproteobacteria bacterium]
MKRGFALGNESTTDSPSPVQADAPSANWQAVAPGFVHTCAGAGSPAANSAMGPLGAPNQCS